MSTAEQSLNIAPLVEGERLGQKEFHRRYEAMPPGTRAELINGVVYLPRPVGVAHGQAQVSVIVWLAGYEEGTPGVEVLDNATAILGRKSEPQPDALLRILPECGGQTRNERGFVRGAPELIVEVAKASRYIELGPKLDDYQRAGVREYVVHALDPSAVVWHVLASGVWRRFPCRQTASIAPRSSRASGSTRRRCWLATMRASVLRSNAGWPLPSTGRSLRGSLRQTRCESPVKKANHGDVFRVE